MGSEMCIRDSFSALHLDLVGPLPESEGCCYLLTIIDRFSQWLEAIPLPDMTAKTCARALLRHWVARFGAPDTIVTDRGRQFTSDLWGELTRCLGISSKLTTSYHPQSNGMIERQHRTLKDRLIARACSSGDSSWMEHLPFVLLGLRTSIRADSGCSPSDILYGSPLRLPGDLVAASPVAPPSPSAFAANLRAVMLRSNPMPVVHHGVPVSRVDPRLLGASHVFLRVDAVRRPLVPPYEGPFVVLERSNKTFVILRKEKPVTVTVDRLKPAVLLPEAPTSAATPLSPCSPAATPPSDTRTPQSDPLPAPSGPQPPPSSGPQSSAQPADLQSSSSPRLDPDSWPLPTHYGRRPRPPSRLNL